MSEADPTPTTEDPPPSVDGESATSDKDNAEMFGPEESRDVAVTSSNADEVKNGCENGTEGTVDEDADIVEADDANGGNSDRGLQPTRMSEADLTPTTEDPPPLVDGESATSDKNNAEMFGPEESIDVAVTSGNADEVKNGCENGTEGTADEDTDIVEADDDRGSRPTGMSEANPTPATENSPSLVNGESAASSDKNNAEKFGPEESREVAVTSNSAGEVKNGYENGTEGAADEYTNTVETDDANGGNSGYPNVVCAEDVKMVDPQHKANIEAGDVKMIDTQYEANIEAEDVKMIDTEHEANIEAEDVKMIDTQHEANIEAVDVKMVGTQDEVVRTHHEADIEAEEDASKDKEGKNGDNQHAKATEGEDMKMVEAKADARNSEAQNMKEDVFQKKNHTNIEDKDMKMVDKEDACKKEGKEEKNEDCQDAKLAEAHEVKIHEADTDVRNAELQGNRGKEEMEDKVEENKNNTDIEDDDAKTVDKEVACKKEGDGNNENSHDAKIAASDEMNIVVAKTDAGTAEVEKKEKEEKAEKTEEEKNNANIETEKLIVLEKGGACQEENKKVKNQDIHDAKESDGEDMKIVEGKTDLRILQAIENREKEEMEGNAGENKNRANIDTESVIMIDKENACQHKHKEGKTDDSQDAKAAEGEDIKMVEAKSGTGNAEVNEDRKKEEKEEQSEEKANYVNNQTDEVKIVDKEDACQKEDRERKNKDSHGIKAADSEEIMVVEAKSAAGYTEVKENGKKEESENKTEEEQNDNTGKSICLEKQDEDKMEPAEVDKQEKQNGLKEDEKGGVDKHELSGREEIIKENQEVLKGEAKGNMGNQEMDDREQNVKEKQEGLEDEGVGPSKPKTAKDEQDGAAEKQEGEKQDANVAAEKEEEEKQDAKLTTEKIDKIQDGKVAAEKKEYEEVKETVSFEKNAEIVMEMDVSEKDPAEVDKQERQDGLKEVEKVGIEEHKLSDREESIEESQEVLKGEAKRNVGKREMDDREQNVKEKQEGLEEEGVGSSKPKEAKDEQDGAAEKQEGDKQDVNVAAEKKEEEKQLTTEQKDKTQDDKVSAEQLNENVSFEKNAEVVIEMGISEKGEEMEMNGKATANKQEEEKDNQIDDISKQVGQRKGTKRSNADMEEAGNGTEAVAEVGESDKNMSENKDEAPKSKKARVVREEGHKKDKKQGGSKSREAKDLLNNPRPYSLDRPMRERKTVQRLVEVVETESGGSLFVEKGRGTPLKNIPGVSYRISRKQNSDLKFLHQILFGRFGRAADFKTHILEFSGFVWHESDEMHRAKAKEKLDNCSKDTLCDLCYLLTIPVSKLNSKKEDIVRKLLNFIAEPHSNDDSTLSDDQVKDQILGSANEGGNATKSSEVTHKRSRKNLDDEHTSRKRQQKYSELESDEEGAEEGHDEDAHIKSDRKENKDDSEEADDEQEDSYTSRKVKASKQSMEGKEYAAKRKAITGSVPKTAPVPILSKCSSRVSSSSKNSKDKQSSAEDSDSRKNKTITPKRTANAQKETGERRSSGKGLTRSKWKSAEAENALPSKAELQIRIVKILKKVDLNMVTYSDILKMLDEHYKMDLSSMKEAIKFMVYDELVKKAAESDED